jgi:hypothetical protein
VILQVGLDETGYGQSRPDEAFVFAGYAGSVAHVETFTHVWDLLLNEPLPSMSVFELKKRVRWRRKTDPRVLQLVRAVQACHLHGVRFKVGQDDFQKALAKVQSLRPRAFPRWLSDNPYCFAFMSMMAGLIAPIRSIPDAKIEIIYDENLRERKKLEMAYQSYREFERNKSPEISRMLPKDPLPRNEEEFSLLQAADALAWHSHRAHVEAFHGRPHVNEVWDALNAIPFYADDTYTLDDLLDVLTPGRMTMLRKAREDALDRVAR